MENYSYDPSVAKDSEQYRQKAPPPGEGITVAEMVAQHFKTDDGSKGHTPIRLSMLHSSHDNESLRGVLSIDQGESFQTLSYC